MSPETVIRVERLSKQYTLGETRLGTDGLRHVLHDFATAPFRRLKRKETSESGGDPANGSHPIGSSPANGEDPQASRTFHALKDVTFDVKRGEVVGIVGRNGAGKSTLLKILSRIIEPTTGRVGIKGRVASLLEVGTGFHPELTGRENIYLNGAILGMTRQEIQRKFDEIVDFAEIDKFLDTPVKRYSSGMYVRLAFAVAAHLEPEILVVDEVLAVGDAGFQKKCLGKMGEVAKGGRTVLFVSHNLAAVQKLCLSAILLHEGRLLEQGTPLQIIPVYLECNRDTFPEKRRTAVLKAAVVTGISVNGRNVSQRPIDVVCGQPTQFAIDYTVAQPLRGLSFHIGVYDMTGIPLVHFSSRNSDNCPELFVGGTMTCLVPKLPLAPQKYNLNIAVIQDGKEIDHLNSVAIVNVEEGDFFGTGDTTSMPWAPCLVSHEWIHDKSSTN